MTTRPTSRIPRSARVLTLVAALLLGALYATPLWSVRLVAPQYPEGIGMYIKLHTIEGMSEHDLNNINNLNHYIGMKTIEPDAIPELKYMPWIAAGLIASGLVVAALGRRRLLVGWLAAFALLGAAGLYDFWRWSYDYGHNLDYEHAIMVLPDMTYQPPILGTKQLANFTATSLPSLGGLAAGGAFAFAAVALLISYRRRPPRAAAVGVALAAAACAGNPQIALGMDACVECRMVISDGRFGALLVTSTGRTLPFDSVDCMLEQLRDNPGLPYRSALVLSAAAPGQLHPAEDAVFVRDGALRPPMGNVVAFANNEAANAVSGPAARIFSWSELRREVPSVAH